MLLDNINPFVRQTLHAHLTNRNKPETFNKIKSVDGRLFYITSGCGKMRFESEVYNLEKGSLILFGAGTPYIWEVNSISYYAINFDYTQNFSHIKRTFHPIQANLFTQNNIIEKCTFEDCLLLNEPIVLSHVLEFEKDVTQIATECMLKDEYSTSLTSALLKSLIIKVVKRKKMDTLSLETKANIIAKKLIDYISNNYSNELNYEILEKEFHFNPSYLNRIFKAHTGKTLHEFILQYRLNTAMELLRTQTAPINQIATVCGFTNPYHFAKAFRKVVGVSPTKYRNNKK